MGDLCEFSQNLRWRRAVNRRPYWVAVSEAEFRANILSKTAPWPLPDPQDWDVGVGWSPAMFGIIGTDLGPRQAKFGWVRGVFSLAHRVCPDDTDMWFGWIVTHLPTGARMCEIDDLDDAKAFCEVVADYAPNIAVMTIETAANFRGAVRDAFRSVGLKKGGYSDAPTMLSRGGHGA